MTRAELMRKERTRARAYSYAFWFFEIAIVGGIIAFPSLRKFSPSLAALTGDSWLVPLIVGTFLITIWNQARMLRCPHCRRPLNGPVAIATDRCGHCGQI